MEDRIMENYRIWRENAKGDPDVEKELQEMEGDEARIEDAFYRDLAFGTGGLRGVIGAGTNRMNIHTVAKASQGLADYVIKHYEKDARRIAVSYDSRIKSDLFAQVAAGVFAAGLQACGVIKAFVDYLTHANEVAKLGAALGPYLMALVTGSGDAAAFAFNEAVTPHAEQFGLSVDALGYLAAISGNFGRLSSPLAGGMIIAAGIAGVSPFEIAKRTAPVMLVLLIGVYIFS